VRAAVLAATAFLIPTVAFAVVTPIIALSAGGKDTTRFDNHIQRAVLNPDRTDPDNRKKAELDLVSKHDPKQVTLVKFFTCDAGKRTRLRLHVLIRDVESIATVLCLPK
jgi:hypothetical protein